MPNVQAFKSKVLREFQFGKEVDFMKKNKASSSEITENGKPLKLRTATIEGYQIKLFLKKESQLPVKVEFKNAKGEVTTVTYLIYETNLKIKSELFELPSAVTFKEASQSP